MANSRVGGVELYRQEHVGRAASTALAQCLSRERDRWFLWTPVFMGCGIAIYVKSGTEPALGIALLPLVVLAVAVFTVRTGTILQFLLTGLAAAALGLASGKLRAVSVDAPILDRKLYAATLTGTIERVEPRPARGPRITVLVRELAGLPANRRPHRVRVRILARDVQLRPGDFVRLKATLAPPPSPALPGGYDFARAAFFKQIGAVGFARSRPVHVSTSDRLSIGLRLTIEIQRLRQGIGNRITLALPGETGAIANALMTGERGQIRQQTLDAYRDAGILHVLSISGLHMAIMGGSVFYLLRLVLAMAPGLALRLPIKKIAAVMAILAAAAYLLVSGTTHATVRAFIMISIMMLAIVCDRPAIALRNVALAALAILLLAPESLFNVGFQMSFAAVVALVSAYEFDRDRRRSRQPGVRRGFFVLAVWFVLAIVATTVIASIAVAPIGAFHFHKSQQFAVLANLIAVPVCNFVVMPAALAAFVLMPIGWEAVPLQVMGQGIAVMTWCAKEVAALPGAVARIPAFSDLAFGLIIIGGLWLCLWRTRWRLLGCAAIGAGLALAPLQQRPDVLVGRDGRLVAVRLTGGKLVALDSRRARFELARWLEHDGDARTVSEATERSAFRCDQAGCTTQLLDHVVAISRRPASLVDDCARATILILSYPRPAACNPDGRVIDFWQLRTLGTHAFYISRRAEPKLVTVHATRGIRPWTRQPARGLRRPISTSHRRGVAAFAARHPLSPRARQDERPEVEGEQADSWLDD